MEHIQDRQSDVVFLNETWLQSEKNSITAEIKTYGYELLHNIRKDREKDGGGGVGIMVRSSIITKQLSAKHYTSFEHTIVKVPLAKKEILYLISLYRLQSVSTVTFMDEFSELLDIYMIPNDLCVIAGDINIHFETQAANAKQFKELLDLYGLQQHIEDPTHLKGHTLDVVITPKKDGFLKEVEISHLDLSDHFLVDFKLEAESNTRQEKVIRYRSLKNVDVVKFGEDVRNKLTALQSHVELGPKVNDYNSTLTNIVGKYATWKTRKIKVVPDAPWFDAEYANLRKLRRNAENKYRRSGLDSDKRLYITLRKQTIRTSVDKKKAYVAGKLQQGNSTKSLYSVVNQMIDRKKDVVLPKADSDKELANRFQTYFKEKIEKIRASFTTQMGFGLGVSSPNVEKLTRFEPTNEEEVRQIIKSHGLKCSPEDPVPVELILPNLDIFIPFWVEMVNLSLESGSMDGLKTGILNPLIKELSSLTDTENYKNYRPVTNLVLISKLVERVVQIRLEDHMVRNNLLTTKNYAYRKAHSTELLLLKVVNDLYRSFDMDMPSVVVLLDLSAAFDTVDHDKLLSILEREIGIAGTALKWFESFLRGRTQKVKIGSTYSEEMELLYGLAQGSVLGPPLFKIYIRSLYKYVEPTSFRIEGFADDHQLIKQFLVCLQRKALGEDIVDCLNHISVWMNEFFLRLNPTKTKILVIAPPSIQLEIIIRGVFLENECIRFVQSAKNLGVVLDDELSFSDHINNVVKSSFLVIKKLSQVKGYLTEEQLQQLISSDVFSKIDYCNSLFYGINSSLIRKMQHVQNCAARLISKRKIASGSLDKFMTDQHWLKVKYRPLYKILLIVHNCLQQNAPEEILELIKLGDSPRTLHLRETNYNNKYGCRAFSHAGPKLWNLLPIAIRNEVDTERFKKSLKSFLMLRGEEFYTWINRH